MLTRAGDPVEIAHIFPLSMRHLQSPQAIEADPCNPWQVLRNFWREERVQKWYDAVAQTTETTKNLLCLAPQVRAYHERAYFALKPIDMNEEKTRLDVIFSWLPRFNYPRKLRLSTPPPSLPSTVDRRVHDSQTVKMWDTYTDSKNLYGR